MEKIKAFWTKLYIAFKGMLNFPSVTKEEALERNKEFFIKLTNAREIKKESGDGK